MNLFQLGEVTLHSGLKSHWKIECDALTNDDWRCLAYMGLEKLGWPGLCAITGVPLGGLKLAGAVRGLSEGGGDHILICDDVLTTGASMEAMRKGFPDALGLVVFARGRCPSWVTPIFQM